MTDLHLHIISFDNPYPPDYGGVIDVFYKVKALHAAGVKIHLHCFAYGRLPDSALDAYCEEIYFYPRDKMWKGFFSEKPFIVQSRNSPALKNRLLMDQYPILFEGLHCCFYLNEEQLKGRLKFVRMHNDEAKYYLHLAQREQKIISKLYYYAEYRRLMKYEQVLQFADTVFCIASSEAEYYRKRFSKTIYLPPFHGNELVNSAVGKGDYLLYHGNLAVSENEEAALWLVQNVFPLLSFPIVIAGNLPSERLRGEIAGNSNIRLVANPSQEEMNQIINNAHIHVLPTFQSTGIKLKMINALFNGRFCVTNSMMVQNTGLEKYCHVADTPEQMIQTINNLINLSYTEKEFLVRKELETEISNARSANQIITSMQ